MKHLIPLLSVLPGLGLTITAQAQCDSYPSASTHTLTLPATITVPDSLPVGSLITRQPFSGTAPALFINCPTPTEVKITGKYPNNQDPVTRSYRTEVPGIGIRINIRDARGVTNNWAIHSQYAVSAPGTWVSLTSAEAEFYKIGPVTDGTMTSADIFEYQWHTVPNMRLRLGNPVRFLTPAATCELSAGDLNRTITLDPVHLSALQHATSAGATPFELTAQCNNVANVTFRFTGAPAAGNDRLFANTGTAGGVALWLYSRIDGGIQDILANGTGNTRTVAVTANRAVLPLGAAYHNNGAVSQGTLISTATVTITYN